MKKKKNNSMKHTCKMIMKKKIITLHILEKKEENKRNHDWGTWTYQENIHFLFNNFLCWNKMSKYVGWYFLKCNNGGCISQPS